MMAILPDNPFLFKLLPEHMRDNEAIAKLACQNLGSNFNHVSDRLKKKRELVLEAV